MGQINSFNGGVAIPGDTVFNNDIKPLNVVHEPTIGTPVNEVYNPLTGKTIVTRPLLIVDQNGNQQVYDPFHHQQTTVTLPNSSKFVILDWDNGNLSYPDVQVVINNGKLPLLRVEDVNDPTYNYLLPLYRTLQNVYIFHQVEVQNNCSVTEWQYRVEFSLPSSVSVRLYKAGTYNSLFDLGNTNYGVLYTSIQTGAVALFFTESQGVKEWWSLSKGPIDQNDPIEFYRIYENAQGVRRFKTYTIDPSGVVSGSDNPLDVVGGVGIAVTAGTVSLKAPTGGDIGGVKAGTNITIAPDGTISAAGGGGGVATLKHVETMPYACARDNIDFDHTPSENNWAAMGVGYNPPTDITIPINAVIRFIVTQFPQGKKCRIAVYEWFENDVNTMTLIGQTNTVTIPSFPEYYIVDTTPTSPIQLIGGHHYYFVMSYNDNNSKMQGITSSAPFNYNPRPALNFSNLGDVGTNGFPATLTPANQSTNHMYIGVKIP